MKINNSRSARLQDKYRAEYSEVNRCVKRKIRIDKRAYVEELAKQSEEARERESSATSTNH